MRVTVNLSIFFHDHRSLAKIYINKDVKLIRDVEQHISNIFKIHDFYLKCENQYLPPTEDVQVLHAGDLIWAIPKNRQEQTTIDVNIERMTCNENITGVRYNLDVSNTCEEKSPNVAEKERNKKKEWSEFVCNTSTCEEETSVVYKKKKKRQKETQEREVDDDLGFNKEKEVTQSVLENTYTCNKTSSDYENDKKKAKKRSILEPQKSDELTHTADKSKKKKMKGTEEILDITIEKSRTETGKGQDPSHLHTRKRKSESMECDADNNNCVNVSNRKQSKSEQNSSTDIDDASKTRSISYLNCGNSGIEQKSKHSHIKNSRSKQLPIIMPLDKKINIVKTIIISKSGSVQSASPQRASSILMSSVTDSINAEVVPENDSFMIPDSSLRSSVTKSNCEVVSENDLVEIDDANVTRRQTNGTVSEDDLPSPILRRASSKMLGFKFLSPNLDLSNVARSTDVEDSDRKKRKRRRTYRKKRNNTTDNISVDHGVRYQNVPQVEITPCPEHTRFEDGQQTEEIIIINESHENGRTFEIDSLTTSLIENDEQAEEFEKNIAKHPIIQNMDPKVDDIIAFKILRMSENYTPEVSSNIVGKVLKFGPENKRITFKILRGRNQCVQPQGKFSLDSEEGDGVQPDTFHAVWPNLLEPRLLFP